MCIRDRADISNAYLERAGSPERIDHRSNAERGIDELPTEMCIRDSYNSVKPNTMSFSVNMTLFSATQKRMMPKMK